MVSRSASTERWAEVYLAGEMSREQSRLYLEDTAVADRVAEMRMGDERVQAPFVAFEHLLSPVRCERAGSRASNKVRWAHLAVIDQINDDRVSNERTEFFHQIEGKGRPPIARLMVEAQVRVQSDAYERRHQIFQEHCINEREQGVDGITRRAAVRFVKSKHAHA